MSNTSGAASGTRKRLLLHTYTLRAASGTQKTSVSADSHTLRAHLGPHLRLKSFADNFQCWGGVHAALRFSLGVYRKHTAIRKKEHTQTHKNTRRNMNAQKRTETHITSEKRTDLFVYAWQLQLKVTSCKRFGGFVVTSAVPLTPLLPPLPDPPKINGSGTPFFEPPRVRGGLIEGIRIRWYPYPPPPPSESQKTQRIRTPFLRPHPPSSMRPASKTGALEAKRFRIR